MAEFETFDQKKKLENQTLADQIFQVLKTAIIRQEYQPGERLVDQDIANDLGVSRTPVREAINRLAAEGLISINPRRGVFVTELCNRDIEEMYEIREALETLAVQLVFRAGIEGVADNLERIMKQYQAALEADDLIGCYDLDRQFHEYLIRASKNSMLEEMYHTLSGKIQVSRWKHCQDRLRTNKTLSEHECITNAFRMGNVDAAIMAVQDHIRKVHRDLVLHEQAEQVALIH